MEKSRYDRKCKVCDTNFSSFSRRAIYCCKECFKAAYKEKSKEGYASRTKQKNCKYCGDLFFGLGQQRLCDECKGKRTSSSKKIKTVFIHCCKCDVLLAEKVKRDIGQSDHQKGATCEKCKNESNIALSERMRENNPNPLTGKAKPKKIKETKEETSLRMKKSNPMFNTETVNKVKHTFKSKIISGEIVYKRGAEHHLWKGNRDRAQTIRTRLYSPWIFPILERDNFSCCNCGKKGGRLEVHHISPTFKEILEKVLHGRDLKNLTDEDFEVLINEVIEAHKDCAGITYCKACHKEIDPCRR